MVPPCCPTTVREFCLEVLESGDLASKLRPPRRPDGGALADDDPGLPLVLDEPRRDRVLAMGVGVPRLPPLGRLRDRGARAICLQRFAHHELMAVELFAWALVTWPEMPRPLRRGMLAVLADEQVHLALYLERLAALGSGLEGARLSSYLWRHAPAIRGAPDGVLAFLCAMGLTFEQANLDFALTYRDAFRAAGDEEAARVVERVHRDELGHVRLAVEWLRRLKAPERSDFEAYRAALPFPLSPARAKGRRFDADSRRLAGLDDAFIEGVRLARPDGEAARRV